MHKVEYPYVWNRDSTPKDRKGQRCRVAKWHNKSQGIVVIEFKKDLRQFIVRKSGLKRVAT